jgi:hypothetical protein
VGVVLTIFSLNWVKFTVAWVHMMSGVEHWGSAQRIPSSVRVWFGNHCTRTQCNVLLPCNISWKTMERKILAAQISNFNICSVVMKNLPPYLCESL